MCSATFILEVGDIIPDDDAIVVDKSAVDNLRDDLRADVYSGDSGNARVLTCLCEGIFYRKLRDAVVG